MSKITFLVSAIYIFTTLYTNVSNAACSQITRYSDCVNKNTLKIMGCEAINFGPLSAYYRCLCDTNKELNSCYTLCSDDPILQLESQTSLINLQTICMQADAQVPEPTRTPTQTPTPTPVQTKTTTPLIPVTTTTSIPPKKPTGITIISEGSRIKNSIWIYVVAIVPIITNLVRLAYV